MKDALEIFNTKAEYNIWLKELTPNEKQLVLTMMEEHASNRFDAKVRQSDSQPVQTAGLWVLEVDNENEQYKILTKDKILPVDGKPNQEQQWIASVYCINDAADIIINHNEKIGGLSA